MHEQYRELNQSRWCMTLLFSTIFSGIAYKASNVRCDKYGESFATMTWSWNFGADGWDCSALKIVCNFMAVRGKTRKFSEYNEL